MIGNRPKGDFWRLQDNDPESQHYGGAFNFDFVYIKSDKIKEVLKDYIWMNYRTGRKTLNGLHKMSNYFKQFNDFAEGRNIDDLKKLTNDDIENYISYLRTLVSKKTGKKHSYGSQATSLSTLKSIIYWGQLHMPEAVPDKEIFTGNEYAGVSRRLKIDFIPDEIIKKINVALLNEENQYLKYGIIILQTTGMRVGDLLLLERDCIASHPISGEMISWFDHKNRRMRKPIPVRPECVEAVNALIKITEDIRPFANERDKNKLFIYTGLDKHHTGNVRIIKYQTFERSWLKRFMRDHHILEANGEPYNITTHQFRRTLGTDMFSKDVSINVIQEVLGHANPLSSRRHYADIKDKERAAVFRNIGIVGNINMIESVDFESEEEAAWFKKNKDKCIAGLCDGYCTKPYTEGKICDRLLKRQKCYTCSRYITTPEFLDTHKMHLASLEKEVEEAELIYGEHYAGHFFPTIETLNVIIQKLEELKDANKRN